MRVLLMILVLLTVIVTPRVLEDDVEGRGGAISGTDATADSTWDGDGAGRAQLKGAVGVQIQVVVLGLGVVRVGVGVLVLGHEAVSGLLFVVQIQKTVAEAEAVAGGVPARAPLHTHAQRVRALRGAPHRHLHRHGLQHVLRVFRGTQGPVGNTGERERERRGTGRERENLMDVLNYLYSEGNLHCQ